ncbi:MAG: hypothetical protein EB089_01600 [Acidimicrobiia bacterium]|nr:hypothetical protein [Acidimicrobiia bacterium]
MLVATLFFQIAQNFRDPHDISGEDGAPGRYEENQLWKIALNNARTECKLRSPDYIIIMNQKDSVINDAPVVIRCRFIAK